MTPKSRTQPRDVGAARTTKALTKPETRRRPRAGGDQREPSSSAFCFPAPASLGPGTRRGTPTSESAAGVTRARGAAAAQSPPSPQEPGKTFPTEGKDFRCCGAFAHEQSEKFSNKNKQRKSSGQLAGLVSAGGEIFLVCFRTNHRFQRKKNLGSGQRHPQQYKISPSRRRRLRLQSRTMPKPLVIQLTRWSLF